MAKVRSSLITRPGGFEITDEAVRLCRLEHGAVLADIGCGYGDTARYLAKCYGFDVTGVEVDEGLIERQSNSALCRFVCGDARILPFADNSLDGLIYECSFSKMDGPTKVLDEAFRCLKRGGSISIADFYATAAETVCYGLLGRVESKEHICARLKKAGFERECFTDFSGCMLELFGQLIFEHGRKKLCSMLGGTHSVVRAARPGYGLFIAVKI